jgi:hypothetical protein
MTRRLVAYAKAAAALAGGIAAALAVLPGDASWPQILAAAGGAAAGSIAVWFIPYRSTRGPAAPQLPPRRPRRPPR